MKFFMLFILIFPLFSFGNKNPIILTYTYSKAKPSQTKSISLKEVSWIYGLTKRQTPFYPPSPNKFFNDYLRFKMGVEVALNNKKLVRTPKILNDITNPALRATFEQDIYKSLAETKLQKKLQRVVKQTNALSNKQLQALYKKDPQYNYFYISINHPINPTPAQINESSVRAAKIYKQVLASKKSFSDLVTLYSDDKFGGLLSWNRTKATIHPSIYKKIGAMKDGDISKPIYIPTGFVILKLNKRIPYSKSVHEKPLRDNYFNEKRTVAFNAYMDSLRKHFKIKWVNKSLIKSIK